MAFTLGKYNFEAATGPDIDAWSFVWNGGSPTPPSGAVNTTPSWKQGVGGASSNGAANSGEGGGDFLYIETSGSPAVGQTGEMTLNQTVDAENHAITVEFHTNGGDASNRCIWRVQTNENGAGWITRFTHTYNGSNNETGDNWTQHTADLTGLISHASTQIRIQVELGATGSTLYLLDPAVDSITITGTDISTDPKPEISSVDGDDAIVVGQTNIIVTGVDFGASQGSGLVEIGDTASYGSAAKVTQSIDSWGDTSIQFDFTQGVLENDSVVYLYITSDNGQRSSAYSISLGNPPIQPTVTSVTGRDTPILPYDDYVTIVGTDFSTLTPTCTIELSDNATYGNGDLLKCPIISWKNTEIIFAVQRGNLDDGNVFLFVTNRGGDVSTPFTVNISDNIEGVSMTSSTSNNEQVLAGYTGSGDETIHNSTVYITSNVDPSGGGSVVITKSSIRNNGSARLAYDNTAANTTDIMDVWNSVLRIQGGVNNILSLVVNSYISGNKANGQHVFTRDVSVGTVFEAIWVHEVAIQPDRWEGCEYKDCGLNVLNWQAGDLEATGLNLSVGRGGYCFWLGNGNGGNNSMTLNNGFVDPEKIAMQNANNSFRQNYTVSNRYIDKDGNTIENLLALFFDDSHSIGNAQTQKQSFVTNEDGVFEDGGERVDFVKIRNFDTRITSGTTSTGLSDPATIQNYAVDYTTSSQEIRSYGHKGQSFPLSLTESIGSPAGNGKGTLFVDKLMIIDDGVTVTELVASAIIGVTHTAIDMTITGSLTIEQLYDSRKKYWRDNGGVEPSKDGLIADFGSLEINLSSTGELTKTTKYTGVKTSSDTILNVGSVFSIDTLQGNLVLNGVINLNNLTVSGNIDFQQAGTYGFVNVSAVNLTNNSGGTIDINASNVVVSGNTGSNINVIQSSTITLNGLQVGSDIVFYNPLIPSDGTGNNVVQTYNSIATNTQTHTHDGSVANFNIGIFKAGYKPLLIRDVSGLQDASIPINQNFDPSYK